MDPRNRLWVQLIFPHCAADRRSLLALRAACRGFHAQLGDPIEARRLWLPHTMLMPRMSWSEKVLGWQGVGGAMVREQTTWANCDAGRWVEGPIIEPSHHVHNILYVAGRVVIFFSGGGGVVLLDPDTGALWRHIELPQGVRVVTEHVVMDRWVTFTVDDTLQILDCVDMRLMPMVELKAPPVYAPASWFDSCGPCLSYVSGDKYVVVRIDPFSNTVRLVYQCISNIGVCRFLCDNGNSFMEHDSDGGLRLMDVASGAVTRSYPIPTGYTSVRRDSQLHVHGDYFVCNCHSAWREGVIAMICRISTGTWTRGPFHDEDVMLCDARGRLIDADFMRAIRMHEYARADTGNCVCNPRTSGLVHADTSGVMIWSGDSLDGDVMTRNAASTTRMALPFRSHAIAALRYGVCVVRTKHPELRVMRLDKTADESAPKKLCQ